MKLATVTSGETWNTALAALPLAHVLQTWEWGQFKSRHGWAPRYMLWNDEAGQPRAAALVLRRPLGRLPLCVMYIPKGPAMDYADAAQVNQVLADVERIARQSRAIFIKIDPDLDPLQRLSNLREGWFPSSEQIQFRNTLEIDLRHGEEELLAAMHQKTRYNIRLAARKHVVVREGTIDDLPEFCALMQATGERDRFGVHSPEYYRIAFHAFVPRGWARLFIAEVHEPGIEPAPVAAIMAFAFGSKAWYMYGASGDEHRDRMPNYALQWEAIRWAQSRGCATYDLWGVPDEDEATLDAQYLERDDRLWGVYRFKRGFAGQLVRYIGAFDRVYNPWLYQAYLFALRRRASLAP